MNLSKASKENITRLLNDRVLTLGATLILCIAIFGLIWPTKFFTLANAKSVLINVAINTVVALGMFNLLISGYIDLSVGSLLAMSGAIAASLVMNNGMAPGLAMVIAIALCALIGACNGFMVSVVGINPMIQTLSMKYICAGLTLILAGHTISGLPESYTWIGQMNILNIQLPIWFMILFTILLTFFNEKLPFFKRNYYVGGNQKAAAFSGINVNRMIIFNYVVTGLLAGFAGVLTSARLGVASANAGTSLEMKCISACVLGGASPQGGQGRVFGALLGVIFMGLIDNIIIIAGIPSDWNQFVTGIVLLVAVTMDVMLKRKKA